MQIAMPMKIAMIDPSLFTLPYDQGLATALARAGNTVTLFGRRPGPDDPDPAGVPLVDAFYRLAESRPARALPAPARLAVKGIDHLWSMARLVARLRRLRPDVIHFQWLPLPLVDRRMLAPLRRVAPLVLTVHDTNPFNGNPSSRLQTGGFIAAVAGFDRLIVHNEQARLRLHGQGIPAGRLTILPHGMTRPAHARPADPMRGELTFVLFGKIKPYKGADLLVDAFAALPAALRAQARLRIIGKPYMDLAPLQAQVARLGIADRVAIEPRFVADAEIPAVFGPGTVAVFPYREIDTSGVLYQALEHGRPVVAARIGTFAELLADGVHGVLAEREDVASLAAALARLIEDRDLAAGCARRVGELCETGTGWDAVARDTQGIYAAAIAGRARSREAGPASAGTSRATEVSSSVRKITGGNC